MKAAGTNFVSSMRDFLAKRFLIAGSLCFGAALLSPSTFAHNTLVGTPIDASGPGNADVGNLFRFDGTQYIFNWSTAPVSTGTWQLQALLDDGTVRAVVMGTK